MGLIPPFSYAIVTALYVRGCVTHYEHFSPLDNLREISRGGTILPVSRFFDFFCCLETSACFTSPTKPFVLCFTVCIIWFYFIFYYHFILWDILELKYLWKLFRNKSASCCFKLHLLSLFKDHF